MTVRPQRALLAAFSLAVALVAAIFASAPTNAQDAQDLSVNPIQRHQRANADGTALEGFYYKAADSAFLHHLRIHFVPGRYGAVGPATYRDFGRLELFFESPTRTNLHPGTAVRSDWWFTADGTALAACSDDSHRCRISKTEYQALAGQTGAGDDAVIGPIVIGFKIPSSITDDEIVLQSKHDTSSATRPSSNQWQNSRWTRVDKHRAIVAALTADGEVIPEYVFSNAAGNLGANLVHVRISVGGSHIPGFESATYEQWGTANNAGTHLRINGEISGSMRNLVGGQAANAFFKADGTTALGCNSSTSNDCRITKDVWKALAGQTGEPDTVQIKPIRIAFKVPSADSGGTDFATTPETVTLNLNRVGALNDAGNNLLTGSRVVNTPFTRLIGHVFRLQAASRADGTNTRTPLEPGTPLPDGSTHSATVCIPASTGTDCTRDLEVGEDMYVGSILTRGGTANTAGRWNRPGSAWLQYGFDHFDEIEISFTPTVGAGGGDVVITGGTLCPVEIPASPAHPFVDAPRARTAEKLRVCKWNVAYYGNAYRSAANPSGAPYWDTGTGPQVVGIKAGTGQLAVKHRKDGVLVAENEFTLRIAAATRTNLLSAADAPLITAGIGQGDGGGPLTLQIGYERRRGIPAFWPMTRDTAGSGYYGFARYEDVESVALTVPAGGGTLEVLGAAQSCTATDSASCTITLDKAALKQAAHYGYTPDSGALLPVIADSDAIWRTRLLLHGAASRDVTVTGLLTLSSGTPNTHSFSYTAKAAPNAAGATISAYLRGDSDGILAPGQSAPVAVGYQIPAWIENPSSGNGGFLGKFVEENSKDASVLLTESAAENDNLDGSAIQVLAARQSNWVWTTYSPGETDFEVNPADQVWLGSAAPPLTYRYSPVPGTWAVSDDGYLRTFATPEPAGEVDYAQPGVMTGAYLQITGPATWTANGSRQLRLDRTQYTYVKCVNSNTLNPSLDAADRTCFVTDADGNSPSITAAADASGDVRITASLPLYVLVGAAPNDVGPTLSGSGLGRPLNTHSLRRTNAFGRASIPVGRVTQVDSVALTRKDAATGAVRTGDPARLKLGILNENGGASAADAISSITLTTTNGKLRAGPAENGNEFCQGSTTCSITIGSTTNTDADDLASAAAANPALVAGIFVDLYDVKTAGSATVSATIVAASASGDPVFRAEPLTIVFSGTAASLALSEKLQRVNAYGTPDADAAAVAADPDADPPVAAAAAAAKDDRDVIKIALTAADSRDQTAGIPVQTTITVTGPNGAAVPAGALSASIPTGTAGCNTGRTSCNIVIDVNAPRTSPLASGTYTVKVASGSLTAAQATFGVGSDPAELDFALGDPGAIGTQFEAEITVTDAAGQLVADGTEVSVTVQSRGRRFAAPVTRTTPAVQRTANGRVTARFVVTGREVATIRAQAGSISSLAVADTRSAGSEQPAPAASLTTTQPNTFTAWTGAGTSTASRLLADTPNANRVFLWNGVRWLLYAEIGGTPIPGSLDYIIEPGDVLWLGSPN